MMETQIHNPGRRVSLSVILASSLILFLILAEAPKPAITVPPGTRIFIADFINDTGYPGLGKRLQPILRMALEQSASFVIFPEAAPGDSSRQAPLGGEGVVTNDVAAKLCLQKNIPVFVQPRIRRLNGYFVVNAHLVSVKNNIDILSGTFKTGSESEITAATEELGKQVRRFLGERQKPSDMFASILPFQISPASLDCFLKAVSFQMDHRPESELGLLKQAVNLSPHFAIAQLRLGLLYARLRQPENAIRHVLQAKSYSENLPPKQKYLVSGIYYLLSHRYSDATKEYLSFAAAYPYDWNAHWGVGECLVRIGVYQRAVEEFQEAIRLDHSRTEAYLSLCMAQLFNRESERARKAWEHASLVESDSPEVDFTKGFIDLVDNELASAMEAFQKSRQFSCCRSVGTFLLAQAQIYGGRFEAALQTLEAGIKEDRDNHDYSRESDKRLSRAQVFLLLGNHAAANRECGMISALGDNPSRLAQLGSIYARTGQLGESRELLKRIESLKSEPLARSSAKMLLGEIQLATGGADQAIRSFALARESGNSPLEPLARALVQAKQWERAAKEYASVCEQKAAMLFPADQPLFTGTWVQALYDAGKCSLEAGRIDEARQYFRQYLWVLDGADTQLDSLREARTFLSARVNRKP